jgi:DNA-binding protein HU-beta
LVKASKAWIGREARKEIGENCEAGVDLRSIHQRKRISMNKSELINVIAAKTELSKAKSAKALDALLDVIVETVARRDDVSIVGFGSFKSAARAAREGKNPRTGEKIRIPATTVPRFSAGMTFRTVVAAAHKGGQTNTDINIKRILESFKAA